MSPKKSAAAKKSVPVEPPAKAPLRLVGEAKKRRVPAFRVLTNRALVAVAEARPTSSQALLSVKGLGPKVVQQSGRQLIELCSRG